MFYTLASLTVTLSFKKTDLVSPNQHEFMNFINTLLYYTLMHDYTGTTDLNEIDDLRIL